MGDNKDNSQDSRVISQVGFVPRENLVGRAEILFFSTNGSSVWWNPYFLVDRAPREQGVLIDKII